MKNYTCDHSGKAIQSGECMFKIAVMQNGQNISPEQHQRISHAATTLQELEFASPKDMAEYILKHPEIHTF